VYYTSVQYVLLKTNHKHATYQPKEPWVYSSVVVPGQPELWFVTDSDSRWSSSYPGPDCAVWPQSPHSQLSPEESPITEEYIRSDITSGEDEYIPGRKKTLVKPDTLIFGRRLTMKVRHGLCNEQHAARYLISPTETKWYEMQRIIILSAFIRKYDSEIRFHPRTGHEGPEEKKSYSPTLSSNPGAEFGCRFWYSFVCAWLSSQPEQ